MSPAQQLVLAWTASFGLIGIAFAAAAHEPPIDVTGDAYQNHEPVHRSVKVADLDLATATGQHEALKRVDDAVRLVCPTPAGNIPRYQREHAVTCQKTARAQAHAQLEKEIAHAKAHPKG